jgi:UDP-GlcNAc:undecaprenyl-phosphate GlcNAc-1-phosphate transferase
MNAEDFFWLISGAIVPGFLVSWTATVIIKRVAPRLGLIDKPGARKVHTVPTPLGGGLAIYLGVIVPFLLGSICLGAILQLDSEQQSRFVPSFALTHLQGLSARLGSLWILLGCGTVLTILGLLDDRYHLEWKPRLAVEFMVALLCVVTQGWRLTAFINLPYISWMLSVGLSAVWIVALINSFNMLDNMDGLSSGVAAIAAAMLAAVLLLSPDPQTKAPQLFVAGLLLVLTGSLLGFLCHNYPPARIFMGDAGSYFIGFCIAVCTLLSTYTAYAGDRPHAVLAPLCVMAVPLYDMITVLYIRHREGRSWFQGDKNHFSHRLVDLGFSKAWAVVTIYLTTATCGLGALLLHRVDLFGAAIILLMILCVLTLIGILESTARRKLNGKGGGS